jgi:hypothetical protein
MPTGAVAFTAVIADLEASMTSSEFSHEFWEPEFGWHATEETKVEREIHLQQKIAAYRVFMRMYRGKKAWVHLAAEMQAGKTGVMLGLFRLLFNKSNRCLGITPDRTFVVTGMSDNAWKKQTRERLPLAVRRNIHHNKGLVEVARTLQSIRDREGSLKNVLIVQDESHIACNVTNTPSKMIYERLVDLCPVEKWADNNIRYLTVSATDPAAIIGMAAGSMKEMCSIERLDTSEEYQSVDSLKTSGRIIPTFNLAKNTDVAKLVRTINEKYGENAGLYHIIRPQAKKSAEVKSWLLESVPGCEIIEWDSKNKSSSRRRATDAASSTTSDEEEDINKILAEEPAVPTFILLKNMFYASKTMNDAYVGVMHDRIGAKDDTNLQSLLGRACGYNKSKRTIIFTSMQTVDNYLTVWKSLEPTSEDDLLVRRAAKMLHGKMAAVTATAAGESSVLGVSFDRALPVGAAGIAMGGAGGPSAPPAAREAVNEDNFAIRWEDFATFEEAKAYASRIHKPKQDAEGFYLTSTTGEVKRLRVDDVNIMKSGKKTANLPAKTMKVGDVRDRLYVGYSDEHDPSTARFYVRRLTRTA